MTHALESFCETLASRGEDYNHVFLAHRVLVGFLIHASTCSGLVNDGDREYVRQRLQCAFRALERDLQDLRWKAGSEQSRNGAPSILLTAKELIPLLTTLHERLPGMITKNLFIALENAVALAHEEPCTQWMSPNERTPQLGKLRTMILDAQTDTAPRRIPQEGDDSKADYTTCLLVPPATDFSYCYILIQLPLSIRRVQLDLASPQT